MLWGYFKKLVVADRLAIYVNAVYGNSEMHNGTSLVLATILFAFQIYADFSGYTDIAIGSAKLFGINLTENFRRPYFATSIKDFWDRWHISFSSWLRDYLFLPLAFYFSRKLKQERYLKIAAEKWIYLFAAMITFAICGLWHGQGLNYLVWGLLFGVFLTWANWTEKITRKLRKYLGIGKKSKYYQAYKIAITFVLVSFAWIFFKASSFTEALNIISSIFTSVGRPFIDLTTLFYSVIGLVILLSKDVADEFFPGKIKLFNSTRLAIRYPSYTAVILIIILIGVLDGGQFIYFQF